MATAAIEASPRYSAHALSPVIFSRGETSRVLSTFFLPFPWLAIAAVISVSAIAALVVTVVADYVFQRELHYTMKDRDARQGQSRLAKAPVHEISSENDSQPFHNWMDARLRHFSLAFSGFFNLILVFSTLGALRVSESSEDCMRAVYLGVAITLCLCVVVLATLYGRLLRWTIFRVNQPGAQLWSDGIRKLSFEDFESVVSQQPMLDQFRLWVENIVRPLRVNWYPFHSPAKPLPCDSIRIRTVCVSSNVEVLF
jgi:hypothetical protein